MKELEVIPPNPDAIAIIRLYLEKMELMTQPERVTLLGIIRHLSFPLLMEKP